MSKEMFDRLGAAFSRKVTKSYSTSFSIGIALLHKSIRADIYSIYAYVRFADEIVDTFHDYQTNLSSNRSKNKLKSCLKSIPAHS